MERKKTIQDLVEDNKKGERGMGKMCKLFLNGTKKRGERTVLQDLKQQLNEITRGGLEEMEGRKD